MMVHSEATARQLRSFGFLVGGVFAVIGAWPMIVRREDPRLWAVILAALLILPALVYPKSLKWPYRAWMAIGHVLAFVNTRIILGIIFFLLFTPVGFVMRLFGWDPMRRRTEQASDTYRLVRDPRPADHMKHQF